MLTIIVLAFWICFGVLAANLTIKWLRLLFGETNSVHVIIAVIIGLLGIYGFSLVVFVASTLYLIALMIKFLEWVIDAFRS